MARPGQNVAQGGREKRRRKGRKGTRRRSRHGEKIENEENWKGGRTNSMELSPS
jgi:hypothetical protein